ncbi:MAG: hypothetical protein ABIT37_09620, partial [Luteolibacter sp.]
MALDHRRKRITFILLSSFVWLGIVAQVTADPADAEEARAPRLSLLELREAAAGKERSFLTFELEGVVCAFSNRGRLIALNDGTSCDLLELPSLPTDLTPGDRVVIKGSNCLIGRGPLAIGIGTPPVIGIDGNHAVISKSGTAFLQEGMRPLQVEWFNGTAAATLKLEYEGEGLSRQKVTPALLWHRESGESVFKPGLEYVSYIGENLESVDDFFGLKPVAKGVVPDFDVGIRARPEMAGLVFSGFVRVPRTGLYKFYLTADDGARFRVMDEPVTCSVVRNDRSNVAINSLAKALYASTVDQWVASEGLVTYAAGVDSRLEMEVTENSHSFHVTAVDSVTLDPAALIHKNVSITGLKREAGIVVIDEGQIKIAEAGHDKEKILTKAFEVRQLQPDDPVKSYRADLQGVVTMVTSRSFVLQDATGGVFVHYSTDTAEKAPHASELWKIEGKTGQGDFAPVLHVSRATYLGNAALPKPVQPTSQQLASGSLDAELVEIEGVVMAVSNLEMRLLTRSGNVTVLDNFFYPLVTGHWSERRCSALVGSTVRLRGVYRASWDTETGAVQSGRLMLGNVTMSVDEPASGDPFFAPLIRPSELLLFTSHPTALKRVRVSGQLL